MSRVPAGMMCETDRVQVGTFFLATPASDFRQAKEEEYGKGNDPGCRPGNAGAPADEESTQPMVPILGKPVLEYLIEHLARYGVREIMINVAFNHWKIEHYFGDGHRWGVEIGYSFEGVKDHGISCPGRWARRAGCARSRISADSSMRPRW